MRVVAAWIALLASGCVVGDVLGGAQDDRDDDTIDDSQPELTADQHYCDNQPNPKIPLCGVCVCCLACAPTNPVAFRIDDVLWTLDEAGAVVENGRIVLAGASPRRGFGLSVPAAVASHTCASDVVFGATLLADDGYEYSNVPLPPRLPCTLDMTRVDEVGGRIEGTFAFTLEREGSSTEQIEIIDGTFSVERASVMP